MENDGKETIEDRRNSSSGKTNECLVLCVSLQSCQFADATAQFLSPLLTHQSTSAQAEILGP